MSRCCVPTQENLQKIRVRVQMGKLKEQGEIGLRVGKVIYPYKVAKHFELTIDESTFSYALITDTIINQAALDRIYIIRTSLDPKAIDSAECLRSYKALTRV